jgi:hypothetical protein
LQRGYNLGVRLGLELFGQGLAKGHVLNRKAGKGITGMASVTLLAWCVFFRGGQGERFSLAVFWVPIGQGLYCSIPFVGGGRTFRILGWGSCAPKE